MFILLSSGGDGLSSEFPSLNTKEYIAPKVLGGAPKFHSEAIDSKLMHCTSFIVSEVNIIISML